MRRSGPLARRWRLRRSRSERRCASSRPYAQKQERPYAFAAAVRALIEDEDLPFKLGYAGRSEMLSGELPELDETESLQAADVAGLCTADEVAKYGWVKVELFTRLVTETGLVRPTGDIGELKIKVPSADGHAVSKRFADATAEELEQALAQALEKGRKPPPPRRDPDPVPSPTPAPAPEPALPTPPATTTSAGSRPWLPVLVILAGAVLLVLFLNRSNPLQQPAERVAEPPSAAPPMPASAGQPPSTPVPATSAEAPTLNREPQRAHVAPARKSPAAEAPAPEKPPAEKLRPGEFWPNPHAEDEKNDLTPEQLREKLKKPPRTSWE
jgi:hypothetical protein